MEILSALLGTALIVLVLWESFETIVFPRRVTRRFRLTRLFYRSTWLPWSAAIRSIVPKRNRETWLSFYGPLSLILLLTVWAVGLIVGFALLYWATGSGLHIPEGTAGFGPDLYLSGTNFFTLGLGDVVPSTPLSRLLTVVEAGMGFGFLALVIGFLPALNQSFASREVSISLLDARAGSPPTASEILCRHSMEALQQLLHEWERWSAEFLEIHLSYPALAYFRSQHDNQSWIAALTAILDTCSLIMVGLEGACERQAELTFAIARHAVVDLSLVFRTPPHEPGRDRLNAGELADLRGILAKAGLKLPGGKEADQRLAELRRLYEPYIYSLSEYLYLTVPPWIGPGHRDNWQRSAWERRSRQKIKISGSFEEEHF